jgi:hypothetical protein
VVPFAGDPLTLYVAALSPAETRLKVISLTSTKTTSAPLATAVAVAGVKVSALVLTAVIVKLVVPSPATVNWSPIAAPWALVKIIVVSPIAVVASLISLLESAALRTHSKELAHDALVPLSIFIVKVISSLAAYSAPSRTSALPR